MEEISWPSKKKGEPKQTGLDEEEKPGKRNISNSTSSMKKGRLVVKRQSQVDTEPKALFSKVGGSKRVFGQECLQGLASWL